MHVSLSLPVFSVLVTFLLVWFAVFLVLQNCESLRKLEAVFAEGIEIFFSDRRGRVLGRWQCDSEQGQDGSFESMCLAATFGAFSMTHSQPFFFSIMK